MEIETDNTTQRDDANEVQVEDGEIFEQAEVEGEARDVVHDIERRDDLEEGEQDLQLD